MPTPEHGTYARYASGCELKCGPCETAKREYTRNRARLIAYGEWNPWVDAEPVRQHVKEIQAAGIGLPRLAIAAGVGQSTLNRLIHGEPKFSRPPTRSMRPEVADRILAVSTTSGPLAGKIRVDATGTRRRLQALIFLGWTLEQLGEGIGASATSVYRALRNETVLAERASSVADLYDRLWDKRPTLVTGHDKTSASKARKMAAERGWAPPMAWDDETIDDPDAVPEGTSLEVNRVKKLPSMDELLWLLEMGESEESIAVRFGATVKAIRQARYRAQKKVTA